MSMEVDLSTPLTAEERAYLAMRGRQAEIERADGLTDVTDPPALDEGDGTGPKMQHLGTAEARAARKEALLEELRLIVESEGGAAEEDDEGVAPYEEWTHKELDAEIERRGLPKVTGDKVSKANVLYADDNESQQQPPA